jgi:hypothetical protein
MIIELSPLLLLALAFNFQQQQRISDESPAAAPGERL